MSNGRLRRDIICCRQPTGLLPNPKISVSLFSLFSASALSAILNRIRLNDPKEKPSPIKQNDWLRKVGACLSIKFRIRPSISRPLKNERRTHTINTPKKETVPLNPWSGFQKAFFAYLSFFAGSRWVDFSRPPSLLLLLLFPAPLLSFT